MTIFSVISELEKFAPSFYRESYDNVGLLLGNAAWECTGVLCTLDTTEAVVQEAKEKGCNLIVSHHPVIFGGLKKITGKNYVEKAVIAAIKNDIAVYAIHTNLDNVISGVSRRMADRLGLENCSILAPKSDMLMKLYTFVPLAHAEAVREAMFAAGGGHIGHYDECSFGVEGTGTFRAGGGASPFVGEIGHRHEEKEQKIEIVFPAFLQQAVVNALVKAHPYEEPAYDIVALQNTFSQVGSGIIGHFAQEKTEEEMLSFICNKFNINNVRHTPLLGKKIKKVALCGGSGSFLTERAIAAGADMYITADVKYHEFFDTNDKIVLADIGHWESEQFTMDLLVDILLPKFSTFAVLKSTVNTNPVNYFLN